MSLPSFRGKEICVSYFGFNFMSLSLFVYVNFTLCVDDRWQRKLFCWYRSDFYVLFWYILKKLDTASGTNELFIIYSTSLYAIHYPQYLFVWYLREYFHSLDMCGVIYRPRQSGSRLLLYYAQSFQHQVKGELTNSNENAFMKGYYSLASSKFQLASVKHNIITWLK